MQLRTPFLALAAAVATTLLVGAAVTEALLSSIAFSAIVGLPVGIAAGLFVGALVLVLLVGRDTPASQRHAATAVGVFGAATLAVFAIAVFVVDVSPSASLLVSAVAGVLVAVGTFVWLEQNDSRSVHAVTSR